MKLAAIIFHAKQKITTQNYNLNYVMTKLFDDGSGTGIEPGKYAEAIRKVEEHGYRARGFWLNDQPALVWSPTPEHFEAAWGPALRAPCRFSRRNGNYTARQVGEAGYLVPTRSRAEIFELRQRYPSWVYNGDLLFVPSEVLYQIKARALDRVRAKAERLQRQRDEVLPIEHSRGRSKLFKS